jgi:hypothetical protein
MMVVAIMIMMMVATMVPTMIGSTAHSAPLLILHRAVTTNGPSYREVRCLRCGWGVVGVSAGKGNEPHGAVRVHRDQKPKTPFVFSVENSNKIFDFNRLPGGYPEVFWSWELLPHSGSHRETFSGLLN